MRNRLNTAIFIILLNLAINAAPGDLDLSFGTGGTLVTQVGAGFDEANAMAIQTDGKIVAAGLSWNAAGLVNDIALVRYDSFGSIDTTFGTNGIVLTDIEDRERADAIKILTDGSILIAGSITNALGRFVLAKYKPNGNPVLTFGTNGIVVTDPPTPAIQDLVARDMAIQSDGKIIVVGHIRTPGAFGKSKIQFCGG